MTLHNELKDYFKVFICFVFLGSSINLFGQCTGTVYDPGGTSNYTNNLSTVTTYTATTGNKQVITFTSFATEATNDYLEIFDGANTSATRLARLSGTLSAPFPTYTSSGLTLTLRFVSNGSTVSSGYVATLSCCTATTAGGTVVGNQSICGGYDPTLITNSSGATAGSGTITYQWQSSPNNSVWTDISGATSLTYDPGAITSTTYFRRRSRTSACNTWGANSNVISKIVNTIPTTPNAGIDQFKCGNSSFTMVASAVPAGNTGTWTVVSGTATITTASSPTTNVTLAAGSTATLRWTISNGTCSNFDDVVIGNLSNTITLGTPVVSSCINQPLQDIATVDVAVSWSGAISGDVINVTHNNKTETINTATSTSPQIIRFLVPANNTTGNVISANWSREICAAKTATFTAPSPCSSDAINCNILYLCGLDKPYDGDPFDHGMIDYIMAQNTGTLTPALTKTDATGYGLYDPMNASIPLSINLDNYSLVIISPTTEGHIAQGILSALEGWKGSVLNMNYAIMTTLGYSSNNYYNYSSSAFTTTLEELLNYDNPTSYAGKLFTMGDYYSTATASVWKDASSYTSNLGGIFFKYAPHSNTQISSTHGTRVYLGYHMNGLWGNPTNGGALPAPVSSYFAPTKHLTIKGKEILDNALKAAATCAQENCTNGIDDDGDGLSDCLDPNCNFIANGEFDNGTTGWNLYLQSGSTANLSIDATKQVSGTNSAKIVTSVASGTEWHVQLAQTGLSLVSGKKYKISFTAKASANRVASVSLQESISPWTGYNYNSFNLTTTSQRYSFEYESTVTNSGNVSILFNLASVTGTVWIDNIEFKEACPPPGLTCPGQCPSQNQLVNGSFPTNVTGWTSGGVIELGTGGTYGNFIVLNNADAAGPFSVYQDFAIGGNKEFIFTGYAAKHGSSNNAKVYLEYYNGSTFISKTSDFNVTKNYDGTWETIPPVLGFTPANTTKIRVVGWCAGTAIKLDELSIKICQSCSEICTNGIDDDGDGLVDALDTDCNTCASVGQNLVTNGEFDAGATGFTSDYISTPIGSMCGNFGIYSVSNRISKVGAPNGCNNNIWSVADRANNGGNFMLIDPSQATGVNDRIWAQTISVCPNTEYVFSVWTKNMYYSEAPGYSGIDPNFQFKINGTILPGADFTMPRRPKADSLVWVKVQGIWNSGSSTSATLNIVNKVPGALGNDLALDGIFFGLCGKTVNITGAVTSFCQGSSTNLSATAQTISSGWQFFEWVKDGVVVSAGTSTNFTATLAGTYKLRAYTTPNNTGCPQESNAIVLTIIAGPSISSVTPASRCGTGIVTLGATASAGTINWYAAATGGTSLGTGTTFTTPSLSATTAYYVDATNAGCTTLTRTPVTATINAAPTITATTPAARCGTGTVILGATASAGTINWYAAATGGASLGTGASFTTPSLSATTTYYVDATNTGCTTTTRTAVTATVNSTPTVSATTPGSRCGTGTVTLGATASAGTINWYAAATGGTSLGTGTTFTTPSLSVTTTYYVDATNTGCTTTRTAVIATVNSIPTVATSTPGSICASSGTVVLNATASIGVINWYSSASGGSILFTGNTFTTPSISSNTTYFAEANNNNCLSNARTPVLASVGTAPTIASVVSGSRCGEGTINLNANASAGTINWYASATGGTSIGSGPNFTTPSITATTTYYVDATISGCTSLSRTAVIATVNPTPTITLIGAIQTTVCEGTSTTVNATAVGASSYLWSANAGSATTPSVTVTPTLPSSTYILTVTNAQGCTISASTTISVTPKPVVSISGSATICQGNTTQLSPSTGGTWISNNSTVASVNNSGLVTGLSNGTATFKFTNSTTTCVSDNTNTVTVNSKPNVSVTGLSAICKLSTTQLSPSIGGTWASNNPTIASVTNSGLVTGLSAGTATFTFTSSAGCVSNPTTTITVDEKVGIIITGDNDLCVGELSNLTASNSGGTWVSNNTTVATINTNGQINAISPGNAIIAYQKQGSACDNEATYSIMVNPKPIVAISGPNIICGQSTTQLSPSTDGTWSSSSPLIASVSNTGLVTGLTSGTSNFIFTSTAGCASNPSQNITVNTKPVVVINGSSDVCLGNTLQLSPTTGGTWVSSNNSVATINNSGLVTSVSAGIANFTFTNSTTGCVSDASGTITIRSKPSISINYNGSICLTNNSQLSLDITGGTAPFTYNWTGPSSYSSNAAIANITNNGNYAVTLTDAYGCSANTNGFVYQAFVPLILNLQTKVCEGNSLDLNATTSGGTSYLWSPNAGNSTLPNVTVTPTFPSSTYFVTITNTLGCTAVANATINVDAKPVVSISGNNTICVGSTTTLSPTIGGTWSSNNPAIASVSNNGIVSGISAGTATFVFTNSTTNCSSNNSPIVTVESKPTLTFSGPNNICIGGTSSILPNSGGTWSSSNVGVATINNQGLISGVAAGNVTFTFTSNNSSCGSSSSTIFSVTPKPIVDIVGSSIFCIGQTTNLVPTSGGTWVSNHPTIASVSNLGVVTALSSGTATFVFTNFSGCSSEPTAFVTINQKPGIVFSGPTSVCVDESSQITPSTNGIWSSSNTAVATITNAGVINAVAPGVVTFTYTSSSTTCSSNPSQDFTVNAKPNSGFTGSSSLCIGGTTTVTPSSGGTWTSSNTLVATVTNAGIVTAIAPGTASLIFTNTTTGCSSQILTPVSVYSKPPTTITGPNSICIGESSSITPSSGGTWVSSNPSVATITNSGIITGIGQGTANFTYFESGTGCNSDPSANITVGNRPTISVTGPTTICEGLTTTLSPTIGGTWVSSNPQVASINNAGVVTGLMQGTASFTYTSNTGCSSLASTPITINGKPTPVYNGPTALCIGENTNISPSAGGTWISNNPSKASITNQGLITALSPGTATFLFTDQNTGCVSNASGVLSINENPILTLNGPDNICIGSVTNVLPSSGGIWSSSNVNIVSINNQGLVFGLAPGAVSLTYVNSTTGCESLTPISITVNPKPTVSITGPSNICIGATTSLSPVTGGTWISLNPTIAGVNNIGVVTGLSQGIARFTFTDSQTGCVSNNTQPIVVNGSPSISISGQSEICIGGNTQLSPSVGGTWTSHNPSIATVSVNGLITGVSNGFVGFEFTEASSGCKSSTNASAIRVISSEPPYVDGATEICLGYQTRLHPSVGVTWVSSNPKIATVSNDGIVTGKAPGKVTFTYTFAQTGCSASLPINAITIKNCVDPDFNVTAVNIPLTGNVSTNDDVPAGTTWGPPIVVNKPSGSISNFTMNADGTYNFVANTKGIYEFRVPVCILPLTFGCPSATIIITVLDPLDISNKTVANLDLATVYTGNDVWMNALANDKCINNASCLIDAQSMQSMKITLKGDVTDGLVGGFIYDPHTSEVGQDTIVYQVCVNGEPTNCVESRQYITINAPNALNSTVASDDFFSSFAGITVTGNVLANDTDPENNTQTILTQGSSSAQITIPQGKYYIDATGNVYFTPATNFNGPVDIIYTVCDNNTNSVCAKATAHILVLGDMTLKIRTYLEGALMSNNDALEGGIHLMRDDLRNNPFDGKNHIPVKDPYKFGTEFVTVNGKYAYEMPGILPTFDKITDSATVFSVTGRNAIVDWVYVELRSKTNASDVIATRSGLIQRDGDVVDLDGVNSLKFPQVNFDSFYVAVRHRNHLGVMSLKVANGQTVDFTNPNTPVFDFGTTIAGLDYTGLAMNGNVKFGVRAMWAGDFDGNRRIKFTNPGDDQNILFFDVFSDLDNITGNANFNNTIGYYQGDYNLNGKSKYDNPNDDKNLLFSQILFYPLNTQYLSNFNFFIEQIP